MEGLKAARGDADPETLRGMNSTAIVLQNYREHSRAAELAQEVWKKRQEVLGENDEDTLASLSTYALALHSLGQFSEAEDLNRHCLAARESTAKPNEAAIMDSANNLAVTLRRKGKYPESLELFRRALEWRELNLRPEHPKTIQTLSDLSSALRDAGEVEKATEPAQKALEILRRVLGDNHPSTLSSMVDLATILRKLGRIDEAEALSTEAEAGMRKRMGSTNPDTLDSMAELAAACMDRGAYGKAAELYQKAMDGYKLHFGEGHADLTRIRANLSFALKKLGRADKAEATYRDALAKLHPMHDDAIKYKLGLAYLLVDQQEYEEATAIYQDIESCLEKSHPGPHDLKAECWYGMAVLLRSRQQYLEAGESMSRAADMFGQTLGRTSTLALNSLSIYAYLLDLQDRFEEAWSVYERSVAGYAVAGGPPTAFSKACEERFEAMKKRMDALGVSAPGGGAGASSERSSLAGTKEGELSKAISTAADGDPSITGKRRAEPSDEPRRETANVKRPRTGATYRF
jgi:tetratricopeptide (TPR) repeat protein